MHDPMTVAHDIKLPWGKRTTLATIWHVDPCMGGHGDDSCGYSFPHLTPDQQRAMKDLGFWEGREHHFLRYPYKRYTADVADREALYRGLLLTVARVLHIPMSYEQAARKASEKVGIGGDEGMDRIFCWLPGYHSNHAQDSDDDRAEHWRGVCYGVARGLLREARPWYRHPKWHVWHWKVQMHPVQNFKRWAFSRCCKCGGRFSWGYCPSSSNWHGTGPRWFRGESGVYHSECHGCTAGAPAA